MQADIQRTTCNVGTCHIWHGKKRMTAHILSYRRIRRYLALSLKATEEHVTLVMWDPLKRSAYLRINK